MRTDYKKTKYTGIYVKECPKTKVKTYLARVKVKGVETEQIVGQSNDAYKMNPSLAFQRRVELINKIKNGESINRKNNPTLDAFFNEYISLRKETLSESRYKGTIYFYNKHVPAATKNKLLKDLTNTDIQKIINKMQNDGYKGSSIKRIKETFSPMYKKAMDLGIVEKNITEYLDFPKFDNTRYFELPKEKVSALVREIMDIPDNYYRLMFMFLLRGRRSNEVRSLQWEDVNLSEGYYFIRDENNKIRKNQRFLLDEEMLQHFSFLKDERRGLIFKSYRTGKKYTSIPRKFWKHMKERVGIEKMSIHDFRHMFGYISVNNNIPLEEIQRALGHSRITTTQKYANQKETMAKKAVDTYLGLLK